VKDQLSAALHGEGYEVDDADEDRIVVLRANGQPVLELDWGACDLTAGDLRLIGQALVAASGARA
jgi:hypothetical protein